MRLRALCIGFVLVGCSLEHGTAPMWTFDDAPGAPPVDGALTERLATAWAARAADYVPRTQHVRPDGSPKYINRLFLESSPYLRQHAHTPLNWFPWGDEAFELARALGRPVLLSIGYSTCHWCHVMEEESFDDEEIARYLNEHYIAIKVDREVRPDLDAIYMSAVQLFLQGRGGWPMTVWLTPDREPYSGGTYFPARDGDRGVSVGFLTLLQRLKDAYDEQPDRVAEVSSQVAERVRAMLAPGAGGGSDAEGNGIVEGASRDCPARRVNLTMPGGRIGQTTSYAALTDTTIPQRGGVMWVFALPEATGAR